MGLTTLTKLDLVNLLRRSQEYFDKYNVSITLVYPNNKKKTLSVSTDFQGYNDEYFTIKLTNGILYLQHSRKNGDLSCPYNMILKFQTDVIAILSFVVNNWSRNYSIPGGSSSGSDKAGMMILPIKANSEFNVVSTCGAWDQKHGQFSAIVSIIVIDWKEVS